FGGRVGQIANQPADALLDSGDLIITIGYDSVDYWPSQWNKGKDRPIVHIDVVPASIENDYSPAVELIGDIEETLTTLSPLLHRSHLADESARLLQMIGQDRQRLIAEAAKKSGVPIHPLRLVSELQRILTPVVTVCSDMGSLSVYGSRYLVSLCARPFLITSVRRHRVSNSKRGPNCANAKEGFRYAGAGAHWSTCRLPGQCAAVRRRSRRKHPLAVSSLWLLVKLPAGALAPLNAAGERFELFL